ncbi:hypothetical protein HIM_02064 [Hirsutella minnesotensis 3608]|nr:hypothetical protein HIM_02064 [Hirsutella minnesotensis 3608]
MRRALAFLTLAFIMGVENAANAQDDALTTIVETLPVSTATIMETASIWSPSGTGDDNSSPTGSLDPSGGSGSPDGSGAMPGEDVAGSSGAAVPTDTTGSGVQGGYGAGDTGSANISQPVGVPTSVATKFSPLELVMSALWVIPGLALLL